MVEHSTGTGSSTAQARSEHSPSPWPTVEEAAELVGRQASTLRRRHDRGNLPGRLETRDGRQVVTLDPAALAAEYEHAAGTLQARFGHAQGTSEHGPEHAERHGSGHGTATPPRPDRYDPAGGGGHGTPPPPAEPQDGLPPELDAEPDHEPSAQRAEPQGPAEQGQALQVAGALLLRLRAEVAEEVDRAHARADRLERQVDRARHWSVAGWGSAAAVLVLGVAAVGWRTVEAREVEVNAQRQVGDAKAETLEALRGAQAREQQLEERHAAELQRVQQDAALKAREATASAWAAGIGLRALGMR